MVGHISKLHTFLVLFQIPSPGPQPLNIGEDTNGPIVSDILNTLLHIECTLVRLTIPSWLQRQQFTAFLTLNKNIFMPINAHDFLRWFSLMPEMRKWKRLGGRLRDVVGNQPFTGGTAVRNVNQANLEWIQYLAFKSVFIAIRICCSRLKSPFVNCRGLFNIM